MTELYSNDGDVLSASSSATFYKRDKMLIGTIDAKALYCETRSLS